MGAFAPGEHVRTPLGKGVVLEVRNRRVLVRVQARDVLLDVKDISSAATASVSPSASTSRTAAARKNADRAATFAEGISAPRKDWPGRRAFEPVIDVHGMTVQQALASVDEALNEALLRDATELRVIHGRSSGRIRDHLHRHLRGLSVVRKARLDPANAGVTVIFL